jgi:hypothetical protein
MDRDRRTPGHQEPNDQEQNKYGTGSHRDWLQKTEEKDTQVHGNILQLPGRLGDITMMLVLLRAGSRHRIR